MKVPIGSLIIQYYQMEDFIDIVLNNGYKVEIEKENEGKALITIYKSFDKRKEK